MFYIDTSWTDDPNGTIPSHKFEFPKGLFKGYNSAKIRIQNECTAGLISCIGILNIDQMFIHTRSPGVWNIGSQQSDVQFSSLDITFSKEFAQLYEQIFINATIYNTGNSYIEDITISFYEVVSENTMISDEETGQIIGIGNAPELQLLKKETFSIEAQSSYTASAVWYLGMWGELHRIYVVIDYNPEESDGYIAEGYREILSQDS